VLGPIELLLSAVVNLTASFRVKTTSVLNRVGA
jgi:hypothetical protein